MSTSEYAVRAGQYWLVRKGSKYGWRRGNVGRSDAALFASVEDAQTAATQMGSGAGGGAPEVVLAPGAPGKKSRADHFIVRRGPRPWYEWIAEGSKGGYFWTDNKVQAKAFLAREAAEAANKSFPRPERGVIRKITRYRQT